jgi:hypothetical protein
LSIARRGGIAPHAAPYVIPFIGDHCVVKPPTTDAQEGDNANSA